MITVTLVGSEAGANEGKSWVFRTADEDAALQRFAKKVYGGSFQITGSDGVVRRGRIWTKRGRGPVVRVNIS